jgi:hypothetical protein
MFIVFCSLTLIAFYGYGVSCVAYGHMVAEFERYGLQRFRKLTGYLQILGATGLLVGLALSPFIGLLAAVGLSVQMLLGLGVRLRIRDGWTQCLPAFLFMWINAGLAFGFASRIA